MGRLSLLVVLTLLLTATFTWAQGDAAQWNVTTGEPGLRASVRLGVQHFDLGFDLPVSELPGTGIAPLDFQIRNANVWIGSARIEGQKANLSFFLGLEGTTRQKVRVTTPTEPFFVGEQPVEWRGSQFGWASGEAGVGYLSGRGVSLIGGARFDRIDLKMSDPGDAAGLFPPIPFTYQGDARTKIWIPFVGLQVGGSPFRARVIASPYAFVDMRLPLRSSAFPDPINSPLLRSSSDLQYTLKKPGGFLEAEGEYAANLASGMNLLLWAKASWLKVRGKGREDFRGEAVDGGILVLSESIEQSVTGTFTRWAYSVGLTLELQLASPF